MTKSILGYRPTAVIKKKHGSPEWDPGLPLKLMTCYNTQLLQLRKRGKVHNNLAPVPQKQR